MRSRVFLALFLSAPGWGWQAGEPPLENRLATPVESYSLRADRLLDAVTQAAGAFHIPVGIEWVKLTDATTTFAHSWRQTTPLTVLRDILNAYPGYALETGNGVVHIFPEALRGDPGDIVNLRIGSFEVNNQFVNFAAYQLALKAKTVVAPRRSAQGGWGASIASGLGDRRVTFRVEDATVRDVLDRLCLAAGMNIWVVAYPKEPAKTQAGYLKTIRLDRSVPDEDEAFFPSWAFLVWGRPLVSVRE